MPPDDELPPYDGPFVTVRPEGLDYIVSIQPVLPSGEGEPLTFGSKNDAWWQVLTFARQHRLPVRDLTIGETARAFDREK